MPTVRTNGVDTYYERRGSGPPIVFAHGAVPDHGQWAPQGDAPHVFLVRRVAADRTGPAGASE